jgi:hypothetical protein
MKTKTGSLLGAEAAVLTAARPSVTLRTSIAPNEELCIGEHVLNPSIAPHPGRLDSPGPVRIDPRAVHPRCVIACLTSENQANTGGDSVKRGLADEAVDTTSARTGDCVGAGGDQWVGMIPMCRRHRCKSVHGPWMVANSRMEPDGQTNGP